MRFIIRRLGKREVQTYGYTPKFKSLFFFIYSGDEVSVTFYKEEVNMVCSSCGLTLGKVSTDL